MNNYIAESKIQFEREIARYRSKWGLTTLDQFKADLVQYATGEKGDLKLRRNMNPVKFVKGFFHTERIIKNMNHKKYKAAVETLKELVGPERYEKLKRGHSLERGLGI